MARKTLKITREGDLDLSGGRAHFIESGEATAQLIRSWLRTSRGEWFLGQLSVGVPYFRDVLRHDAWGAVLEATFAEAILERPGVTALETLELEILDEGDPRELHVRFTANTDEGEAVSVLDVLNL